MDERQDVNREPVWVSPEDELVIGYEVDAGGFERLTAVLHYTPTVERLRAFAIRQYAQRPLDLPTWGPHPPTRTELRAHWRSIHGARSLTEAVEELAEDQQQAARESLWFDIERHGGENESDRGDTAAALERIAGEDPAEFYTRVAHAYRWRIADGSETPTTDLAVIANVPHSTAARWVREARARDLLEPASRGGGSRRQGRSVLLEPTIPLVIQPETSAEIEVTKAPAAKKAPTKSGTAKRATTKGAKA